MVITAVLGVLALYLFGGLKVLREYERAVYFFLGRSWGAKGPGLIYVPPLFAKTQTVSLRVVALDIPPQDVITRDNISLKVNAVQYLREGEPVKAEGELQASEKLAQAAHIIGSEPAAIQLRYLQTVTEISSENNSTTFFPIPIDLFKGFLEAVARKPTTPALPERTSGDTVPAEPAKTKAKA